MADDSFKHQVLEATDIVELISQTVALKRRGSKYLGLCPFHQEKTPSFNVDPVKRFFKCFGCKEGGNAIDFVIKRDRVGFLDALKLLAERANLELPKFGISKEKTSERNQLLDAHAKAADVFHKNLLHPQLGKPARDYLASRGFNEETIKAFKIGYAPPGWDNLLRSRDLQGIPLGLLSLGGLTKNRESGGGGYDTFRNRLMFPIRDEQGRTIAFGGRVMPGSDDPAKYLNSPETPLFSKSKSVFGIDLARPRIVETRTVAIVEGYTDVAMAHQFGASNVVSILGTAMTDGHLSILKRFADRIVLLFDADTAGELAVNRAVELFLTANIEIAIATLPDELDPDEFLLRDGKEAFDSLLKTAEDALAFKWKLLQRQLRAAGESLTGEQKAVEAYLSLIASARGGPGAGGVDPIRWGAALTRIESHTGIPIAQLSERFNTTRPQRPASPHRPSSIAHRTSAPPETPSQTTSSAPYQKTTVSDAQRKAERWILGILLAEPARWMNVQTQVSPHQFREAAHTRFASWYWDHLREVGEMPFAELLSELPDEEMRDLALDLIEESEKLPEIEATLQGALRYFAELTAKSQEAKHRALAQRKDANEEDQLAALLALQQAVAGRSKKN